MSLMKLLTTGKTLVDLKNSTGRYRVPGKNLLPKFGSAKNPFATPPKIQPAQAPVQAVPRTDLPVVKNAAAPLKETQRLPVPPATMKETKRLPFVAARSSVAQTRSEK